MSLDYKGKMYIFLLVPTIGVLVEFFLKNLKIQTPLGLFSKLLIGCTIWSMTLKGPIFWLVIPRGLGEILKLYYSKQTKDICKGRSLK